MGRIAIIGGLGPQASLELHSKLLARLSANCRNSGILYYPAIHHYSLELPYTQSSEDVHLQICNTVVSQINKLQLEGYDFVVIACNTAHLVLNELNLGSNFVNLVDSVVNECKKYRKIGLLGTSSTLKHRLYQTKLETSGKECILPTKTERDRLDIAINEILMGANPKKYTSVVSEIASRLTNDGAEVIVLGCTELPLTLPLQRKDIKIIDTIEVLVKKLTISGRINHENVYKTDN